MKRLSYIIALLLLGFVSCRDFQASLAGDSIMAQVEGKTLMHSDVRAVLPTGYRGADSVAFVETFVDKWIRKQVKLREAERIFVDSETDIEAMVEEYRQLLLIKRLDEYCVSSSRDTTYSEAQILEYFQRNSAAFRLNCQIAKGEVLRLPLGDEQSKKLKELMGSSSESSRNDFEAICQKNGYEFTSLSGSWVEVRDLLDLLPLVRGAQTDKLLQGRGVGHMKDSNYDYYYQIFDYKKEGDIAPLEWVRPTIRTILITERQHTLIQANEQRLYDNAMQEKAIKRQYKNE